jgi:S-adenosylmethionine synthetase
VDRSGAYATRHLAKNIVAAGLADEVLVQVSYAIGVAEPCGLYVNTYGKSHVDLSDGEIAEKLLGHFDLRPYAIEKRLKLRQPMYLETAAYGHMGREPGQKVVKSFFTGSGDEMEEREVELFTWEKLDLVDEMRTLFGL